MRVYVGWPGIVGVGVIGQRGVGIGIGMEAGSERDGDDGLGDAAMRGVLDTTEFEEELGCGKEGKRERGKEGKRERGKEGKRERATLPHTNLPLSNSLQLPKNHRRDLLRGVSQYPFRGSSDIGILSFTDDPVIFDLNLDDRCFTAIVMRDLEG